MNENTILGYKKDRFWIIAVCLMIIWAGFMLFYYLKADEITKDPCTICSEQHGDKVVCSIGEASRIYYENGSIEDDIPEIFLNQKAVIPE